MVTHEALLVEHGPIAAEEAELERVGDQTLVILDGQADVEDLWRERYDDTEDTTCHLTATLYIRVVTVRLVVAAEGVRVVGAGGGKGEKDTEDGGGDCPPAEDLFMSGRQTVTAALLCEDQGGHEGEGEDGPHHCVVLQALLHVTVLLSLCPDQY